MEYCPNCNCKRWWHFCEGEMAGSSIDRFDKVSPDEGWCSKCGFRYSEHVNHPLEEQLKRFKE